MSIIQGLIASISSSSGGTPPPPPPTTYPATLATTGGSLYFDAGSLNYLNDPDASADYQVGTSDFTIEWWQWMLDTSGEFTRPFSMGTYPNCIIGMSYETGSSYFWANGNAILPFSYTRDDLLNTWTHIAISRVSGTTKVFFNGVEMATTSAAYDIQTSTDFAIGNEVTRSAGASFGGYIKDFRFINGAGLYAAAFTPPVAQLTVTAETVLLLSVNSDIAKHTDATGNHLFSYSGTAYADVGPYDLALYVDAGNSLSYSLADQLVWNDLSPASNNLSLTNVSYTSNNGGTLLFDDGFGNTGMATSPGSIASAQDGITPRASISFWANISSNNDFQHIAGMRGGDKFHVVMLNDNANLECRVETLSAGGGFYDNYVNITSRLDTMTHYAMVVNGTRTDTYINGALFNTNESLTGTYTGTLGPLTIAQAPSGFPASGLFMSELRYYNRARSPKEIAAEFTATRTRYGV